MDHFVNTNRSGNEAFTIPLTRIRRQDTSESLLINPGSPMKGIEAEGEFEECEKPKTKLENA